MKRSRVCPRMVQNWLKVTRELKFEKRFWPDEQKMVEERCMMAILID